MIHQIRIVTVILVSLLTLLTGCQSAKPQPQADAGPTLEQYATPLPPGQSALRLVTDPSRWPDITRAYANHDVFLSRAIDESRRWFEAPSSTQFFPFGGVTHDQARASLIAMQDLLDQNLTPESFRAEFTRLFDCYTSVGYNGMGTVLFTGYYAPVFNAGRERTAQFTHPLYTRPDDLVTDPVTGNPQGRRVGEAGLEPYATRREIEQSNMFAGRELVWLPDALSAYIIHVNGSAKLRMPDGSFMYVGYAGKTDRPYASLGQELVRRGILNKGGVTLSAIRQAFRSDPRAVQDAMYVNENYVFFTEYSGSAWPAGSLGVRVTQETSLATDKAIYPRGGLVLVDTRAVTFNYDTRNFLRFMLDQDTGGAIQAPGRADIFMGIGPSAEILAGGQYAEGRLYYFFLKPQFVPQYAPPAASVARRR
jgi:membrane-bound lytic murein transglycosylase A